MSRMQLCMDTPLKCAKSAFYNSDTIAYLHISLSSQSVTLLCMQKRVTRLEEVSPIGRLFSLGSFLKISETEKILGYIFLRTKL
jgi:hypothetical protein